MKYRCLSCEHDFESDELQPRCPKCMRIHDLAPVKDSAVKASRINPVLVVAVVIIIMAAVAVYFLVTEEKLPAPVADKVDLTGPLSSDQLKDTLVRMGVPANEVVLAFAPSPKIEESAKGAARNAGSDAQKMDSLWQFILAWRSSGKLSPYPQYSPRPQPPMTAADLAESLLSSGNPPPVYSYEAAALLTAMARSIGLAADLMEIHRLPGARSPADPSGRFGKFGVAFYPDGNRKQPPLIYDPYAGLGGKGFTPVFDKLGDVPASAAFYNLEALDWFQKGDLRAAQARNEHAARLAPDSAAVRCVRATVFAASGAMKEAIEELERALRFRPDSPRRVNLAEFLLLTDPSGDRARQEIEKAVTDDPDMGRAHGLLAMVHLSRGNMDKAFEELTLAERLEPGSPANAALWAQYHLQRGEMSLAIEKAEAAARMSPENLQAKLLVAAIYRAAGRTEDVKRIVGELFAMKTVKDNPRMAAMIASQFGVLPPSFDAGTPAMGAPSEPLLPSSGPQDLKLNLDRDETPPSHLRLGTGSDQGPGGGLRLSPGGLQK